MSVTRECFDCQNDPRFCGMRPAKTQRDIEDSYIPSEEYDDLLKSHKELLDLIKSGSWKAMQGVIPMIARAEQFHT